MSNKQQRKYFVRFRVTKSEKELAEKLAKGTRSVSSYARAAMLNRPPEDRTIFLDILGKLNSISAQLHASPAGRAKEEAIYATEKCMLWVMDQK